MWRYLGKSAAIIGWWIWLATWWKYLVYHDRFQDGEREATREVITVQLWIFGQVAILVGSIPQHPRPSILLVILFGMVASLPVSSLLFIIGATKKMRNSVAIHHYFDRNSVTLARLTLVLSAVILLFVGFMYLNAQFPGQEGAMVLKASKAEVYKFVRGAPSYKIEPGQTGVALKFPLPREAVLDPLEIEVTIPGDLKAVRLVTAQGKKKNKNGEFELTDFQPTVLVGKGGNATIYWHRLSKENDYELDLILHISDESSTAQELSHQLNEKQVIGVKAFVSH